MHQPQEPAMWKGLKKPSSNETWAASGHFSCWSAGVTYGNLTKYNLFPTTSTEAHKELLSHLQPDAVIDLTQSKGEGSSSSHTWLSSGWGHWSHSALWVTLAMLQQHQGLQRGTCPPVSYRTGSPWSQFTLIYGLYQQPNPFSSCLLNIWLLTLNASTIRTFFKFKQSSCQETLASWDWVMPCLLWPPSSDGWGYNLYLNPRGLSSAQGLTPWSNPSFYPSLGIRHSRAQCWPVEEEEWQVEHSSTLSQHPDIPHWALSGALIRTNITVTNNPIFTGQHTSISSPFIPLCPWLLSVMYAPGTKLK